MNCLECVKGCEIHSFSAQLSQGLNVFPDHIRQNSPRHLSPCVLFVSSIASVISSDYTCVVLLSLTCVPDKTVNFSRATDVCISFTQVCIPRNICTVPRTQECPTYWLLIILIEGLGQ